MFKNIILFYLTLYLLFISVSATRYRRCTKVKSNTKSDTNNEDETLTDNHIPEANCSIIPYPKLIINPYKKIKLDEILKPKNVSALCLRCGSCLAIADKLKFVINEVMEAQSIYDPISLAEIMRNEAKIACETSFKNYDLRRLDNDIIVTNNFPSTTHLTSELDFKWSTVLRKTCQLYVEKIDFLKWFENFVIGSLDVAEELCRGDGLFVECRNVNYHYVLLGDGNYYLAMCTCSCSSKDHIY